MNKLSKTLLSFLLIFLTVWLIGCPTVSSSANVINQEEIVIAAVGDISCDPNSPKFNDGNGRNGYCQMKATAQLVSDIRDLQAFLPLGDNQYEKGTLESYKASYDPIWGKFNNIAYPVPGNHEYYTEDAQGYYQYYGERAYDPTKGYYSYDLGKWHLIALNSNCQAIGGCGQDSPQEQWLKNDLATHQNLCTLAYWHHPRFSSGSHGNYGEYDAFWQDLYQAGVELVLNSHDHLYERFAPQSPTQEPDDTRGIREIVIGTGGKISINSVKYKLIVRYAILILMESLKSP